VAQGSDSPIEPVGKRPLPDAPEGTELAFSRCHETCHRLCDNVGVAGLWWDEEGW
jgi:hypothetical protein